MVVVVAGMDIDESEVIGGEVVRLFAAAVVFAGAGDDTAAVRTGDDEADAAAAASGTDDAIVGARDAAIVLSDDDVRGVDEEAVDMTIEVGFGFITFLARTCAPVGLPLDFLTELLVVVVVVVTVVVISVVVAPEAPVGAGVDFSLVKATDLFIPETPFPPEALGMARVRAAMAALPAVA